MSTVRRCSNRRFRFLISRTRSIDTSRSFHLCSTLTPFVLWWTRSTWGFRPVLDWLWAILSVVDNRLGSIGCVERVEECFADCRHDWSSSNWGFDWRSALHRVERWSDRPRSARWSCGATEGNVSSKCIDWSSWRDSRETDRRISSFRSGEIIPKHERHVVCRTSKESLRQCRESCPDRVLWHSEGSRWCFERWRSILRCREKSELTEDPCVKCVEDGFEWRNQFDVHERRF